LDISISKIERFFDILIIGHGTVWHIWHRSVTVGQFFRGVMDDNLPLVSWFKFALARR
jgi:hypothetical protein